MNCPICGEEMEAGEMWLGKYPINTMLCNYCGELIPLSSSEVVVTTDLEKIEPINLIYPTIMEASMKLNEVIEKVNLIIDYLNQQVK